MGYVCMYIYIYKYMHRWNDIRNMYYIYIVFIYKQLYIYSYI
jgi:hypothetical protein